MNSEVYELSPELWTMILSYNNNRTKFNYRNVNAQFRSIVDRSKMDLVVDLNRYCQSNIDNALDEQMDYLIDNCGKIIKGLVINAKAPNTPGQLLSGVRTVIDRQAAQVEQIVFIQRLNPSTFEDYIIELIGRCTNLKSLKAGNSGTLINLINHPNLQLLKGSVFVNCTSCVHLTQVDCCIHESNINDFLPMLRIVSPIIESLDLVSSLYCCPWLRQSHMEPPPTFKMPNLKHLYLDGVGVVVVDVSQSPGLSYFHIGGIHVADLDSAIGLDLNKHVLKCLALNVGGNGFQDIVSSLPYAPANFYNRLEIFSLYGVPFEMVCNDVVNVLSYNCKALQDLYLRGFGDSQISLVSLYRLMFNAQHLKYLEVASQLTKEQLIKIIVQMVNVDTEFQFRIDRVHDCNADELLSGLYNQMEQLGINKRKNQLRIRLNHPMEHGNEEEYIRLWAALNEQFSIVFGYQWLEGDSEILADRLEKWPIG